LGEESDLFRDRSVRNSNDDTCSSDTETYDSAYCSPDGNTKTDSDAEANIDDKTDFRPDAYRSAGADSATGTDKEPFRTRALP
jgi:hypothetical protein